MTQERQSIFDLSFEKEGAYLVVLKNGLRIAYSKRSEVWFDKAKSQFVTLDVLNGEAASEMEGELDRLETIYAEDDVETSVDIRYNDVSAVFILKS